MTLASGCGDRPKPRAESGSSSGAAAADAAGGEGRSTRRVGDPPAELEVDPRFAEPHWTTSRKTLFKQKGPYNHVHVAQGKSIRTLSFIRPGARREMLQTAIDLRDPYTPRLDYTPAMFASLALRPEPRKTLIVGLGGGVMVHFLQRFVPAATVEAVEIDPLVVKAAREWFGVVDDDRTKVHTADGVAFIRESKTRWDVVYMDVFLRPSAEGTNSAGIPEHATTVAFLRELGEHLEPDGLLVFHMHTKGAWVKDQAAVREAFPHTLVLRRKGSVVLFASREPFADKPALLERAAALDAEKGWPIELAREVKALQPVPASGDAKAGADARAAASIAKPATKASASAPRG